MLLTQDKVIEQFKKAHGNKYDYSKVKYINNIAKVEIICPEHGIFEQQPNHHKFGAGCPMCDITKKLTQEEVIEQFKQIHQDKYDYSLVDYKNTNTKVKIICKKHGVFEQYPLNHKKGAKCPKCYLEHQKSNPNGLLTQEEVIEQFKQIHGNKYDYSKVKYIRNKDKIEIICPEHGSFFQRPANHKFGAGCPHCKKIEGIEKKRFSKEQTIEQFKEVHKDKYNYSQMNYITTMIKVQIICPEHGSFYQTPFNHKQGQGCPKCKINSKEEFLIELFKEYNINSVYNDRELIKPLEIDILIPDFKFGIEHNGLYFHSYGKNSWGALDNYHLLNKNKHPEKTIKMEEQGYQLFHIREDHLLDEKKKDIWKSVLLNKCGFSNKIHARKLKVVDLSNYNDFVKEFLEDNHLQGSCPASIKLGLQDPETGIIYSVMTFGKSRFNKNIEYELLRFCNAKFFNVRGAASKLLKAFETDYKPNSIISYANRNWSMGNLYKQLGFEYSHTTEPNYFYIDNNLKIISRIQVQKHKLKEFLETKNQIFDNNLSERDNMINNGYRIYYDTGNLVYHKRY